MWEVGWCVVDRSGVITQVGGQWTSFAVENGGTPEATGVGASYLAACTGSPTAELTGAMLREVLHGKRRHFHLTYGCHAPHQARFYRVLCRAQEGGALLQHALVWSTNGGLRAQ